MATKEDQKIPVMEIFGPTIQGEGSMCGRQVFFIRFGGCDYRCAKCDSMHAVDGESIRANATYMDQPEILKAIKEQIHWWSPQCITFSGGNPCLWELNDVVNGLHEHGISIALETQGTYYKDWVASCDVITVSPKGPGMGEKFEPEVFKEFLSDLAYHPGLSIKVVVFSAADIEFAVGVQELLQTMIFRNNVPFFLSVGNSYPPITTAPIATVDLRQNLLDEMTILAEEILHDQRCKDFIFLPQMHVLLWGNKQGV